MCTCPASQPASPHAASAVELKAQIEAEREGLPFLIYRDGEGAPPAVRARARQRARHARTAHLGRPRRSHGMRRYRACTRSSCVSGEDWTIERRRPVAERLVRQRRADPREAPAERRRRDPRRRHGDRVPQPGRPRVARHHARRPTCAGSCSLTQAQKRVLVALCRPFKDVGGVRHAADRTIRSPRELFLSVDAVKKHLRALFEKFERRAPASEREAGAARGARLRGRLHLGARALASVHQGGEIGHSRGAQGGALVI